MKKNIGVSYTQENSGKGGCNHKGKNRKGSAGQRGKITGKKKRSPISEMIEETEEKKDLQGWEGQHRLIPRKKPN